MQAIVAPMCPPTCFETVSHILVFLAKQKYKCVAYDDWVRKSKIM